jgi:hypothetical protein
MKGGRMRTLRAGHFAGAGNRAASDLIETGIRIIRFAGLIRLNGENCFFGTECEGVMQVS